MPDETPTLPEIPSVTPKDGWKTSQGQLTAIFTLACIVLSFFGFHYTPEQFTDWVDRAENMATIIGPLLTAAFAMFGYINSRGKIASNALNANAAIKITALTSQASQDPMQLLSGGKNKSILDNVLGGTGWKDPARYENLLHIATEVGVPGAGAADKVNQQIHPADLITGILGMLHHKKADK